MPADGDPGPVAEAAAAYAEAGVDLASSPTVETLPPPHTPAVLEPLAEALAPLTG